MLAPSLASLLEKVWVLSERDEGNGGFARLREVCVSLLCHLLSMATIVCRVRENPAKVTACNMYSTRSFKFKHRFSLFYLLSFSLSLHLL